jgi:heme-degrading monooxygenase HmoA
LARTPSPPYFAVLFSSVRTPADAEGYAAMAEQMIRLAAEQPGFLGVESVRDSDGIGITISYWDSLEAIERLGQHAEHRLARQLGRKRWYETFRLRICRVEQEQAFRAVDENVQKQRKRRSSEQ